MTSDATPRPNFVGALLVLAAVLVPFAGWAEVTRSIRLQPWNLSADARYIFTVGPGSGSLNFSVSITRKGAAASSLLEAELVAFDGEDEITHMHVENLETSDRAYRYDFGVATNYLAYSQFVCRELAQAANGENYPGDSFWFFLRDFVPEAGTSQNPTAEILRTNQSNAVHYSIKNRFAAADKPTKMSLGIGGFLGASYRVELVEGGSAVKYLYNPHTFTDFKGTKEEQILIPPQRWAAFRRSLDAAGVWAWNKQYMNKDIQDGTVWHVTVEWAGKRIKSEGDNAFPTEKDFTAFKAAVTELLGGRKFE
jgi:hypothetical protein